MSTPGRSPGKRVRERTSASPFPLIDSSSAAVGSLLSLIGPSPNTTLAVPVSSTRAPRMRAASTSAARASPIGQDSRRGIFASSSSPSILVPSTLPAPPASDDAQVSNCDNLSEPVVIVATLPVPLDSSTSSSVGHTLVVLSDNINNDEEEEEEMAGDASVKLTPAATLAAPLSLDGGVSSSSQQQPIGGSVIITSLAEYDDDDVDVDEDAVVPDAVENDDDSENNADDTRRRHAAENGSEAEDADDDVDGSDSESGFIRRRITKRTASTSAKRARIDTTSSTASTTAVSLSSPQPPSTAASTAPLSKSSAKRDERIDALCGTNVPEGMGIDWVMKGDIETTLMPDDLAEAVADVLIVRLRLIPPSRNSRKESLAHLSPPSPPPSLPCTLDFRNCTSYWDSFSLLYRSDCQYFS